MYLPLKTGRNNTRILSAPQGPVKGTAGILLYQSILAGEGVLLWTKDDEWAPHLYRKACEDAGKPFALIDLRKQQYQVKI